MKARPEAQRDRFGEIMFRFFYGLLGREHLCAGDPHPGNYISCADGRVCFLDFGLMRKVPEDYLEGERALARAVTESDAEAVHRGLAHLGYLPDPDAFEPALVLEQLRTAGEWYFEPGFRRLDPEYVRNALEVGSSPRSPYFAQMRRQTVPPEALLIRRMEGLLFSVLGELRAGADWGAHGAGVHRRRAAQHPAGRARRPPTTRRGRPEASAEADLLTGEDQVRVAGADLGGVEPPQPLDLAGRPRCRSRRRPGARARCPTACRRSAPCEPSPPPDRLVDDDDRAPLLVEVVLRVASRASSACVAWPPLPMT